MFFKDYVVLNHIEKVNDLNYNSYLLFYNSKLELTREIQLSNSLGGVKDQTFYVYQNQPLNGNDKVNYDQIPIGFNIVCKNRIDGTDRIQNKIITGYELVESTKQVVFFVNVCSKDVFAALELKTPVNDSLIDSKFNERDTLQIPISDLALDFQNSLVIKDSEIYKGFLRSEYFLFKNRSITNSFFQDIWGLLHR